MKHKSHVCQLKETDFFERGTKWSTVEPHEVMKVWKKVFADDAAILTSRIQSGV